MVSPNDRDEALTVELEEEEGADNSLNGFKGPSFSSEVRGLDAILTNEQHKPGESVTGDWEHPRFGLMTFRAMTNDEWKGLNRKHTVRRRVKGTQALHSEMDNDAFQVDVVALCSLDPNYNDPTVRRKIAERSGRNDRNTLEDVLRLVFLPGELARASGYVMELSGFSLEDEEKDINALKG